ncbi:putative inhibitor of apoptosis [Haliotis rufescens]|uniref:putative inhibitor of apoptosis n=1 Tax=Haliotis rufescens TaxID=6454 RepID=UPI00201F0982|nr:putative inhibitor of apoptosis [Haliotis rufescens]XP_046370899.2 putative inhibitor of apoptosis [Haliotis rufescens]XP_046370900.2 putative inhibitor of apoptosis [Haliotis rufescens]
MKPKQFLYSIKLWHGMIRVDVMDKCLHVKSVFLMPFPNSVKDTKTLHDSKDSFEYSKYEFPFSRIHVFPSICLRGNFEALVSRGGEPLQDSMRLEALRLRSFNGVNIEAPALVLAREGLYATGDGDETRCFSCGIRHRNWRRRDRPADVHLEDCCRHNSRNIRFANNPLPSGNQPVRTHLALQDHDVHPVRNSRDPVIIPGSSRGNRAHMLQPTGDYSTFTERLSTYRNWPHGRDVALLAAIARAGFFYEGYADTVRCFACLTALRDWEPGDDPWIEHVRWRPRCDYIEFVRGQRHRRAVVTSMAQAHRGCGHDPPYGQRENDPLGLCLEMGYSQHDILEAARIIERDRAVLSLELLLDKLMVLADGTSVDYSSQARGGNCIGCGIQPIAIRFIPCDHRVFCNRCAEDFSRCPLRECGRAIQGVEWM